MTVGADPIPAEEACYHCGLPIPPGCHCTAVIANESRPMCCPGCQAVAEAIVGLGLAQYYIHRDGPAVRPEDTVPAQIEALRRFDDPELQRVFVHGDEDERTATLMVEGIRCAACAWLIERRLRSEPGVIDAKVGLGSRRALVTWDAARTRLSTLLLAVRDVGYTASPFEPDAEDDLRRAEQRRELRRLGVAGLGTMQVMMFAVALYAGAIHGIEPVYRDFLRTASLLVASVVVFYSARPFFEGARRDLRARRPGMDVPVALAIGSAYVASTWATFRGSGEVYFDAVCMFTFFLGLGRTLESRIRARTEGEARRLLSRIPRTARRLLAGDRGEEVVPLQSLDCGDRVVVEPGEMIPTDGTVLEGRSSVSEALLTGESDPIPKQPGDAVIGGSQNFASPLVVSVERLGAEGTLAQVLALLDRAQVEKVPLARMADRVARTFVGGVLLAAVVVGVVWWQIAPDAAFWVVLSVLVATCPCALSLATPAALAAATNALAAEGFLITRGHVLETLAGATWVVFDKTGTLTTGTPGVDRVEPLRGLERAEALARARALEAHSEHPVAAALRKAECEREPMHANDLESTTGCGVQGQLAGRLHRLGRPEWVAEIFLEADGEPKLTPPAGDGSWVLLGDPEGPLAWFGLRATLRPGASEIVASLRKRGLGVTLLSGDPSEGEVRRIALELGISDSIAGATPEQKLEILCRLQDDGEVVAVVGDGVNDAPILGRAHVSIAMGGGTDLARVHADAVLLGDRLPILETALQQARRNGRVVRQNLAWAAVYNATVLPLAALGLVPPYLAAIGMSASSLLVVGNSLRLRRVSKGRVG